MATAFNWTIAQLEYSNDADKGVVIAHWRVTGTEEVGEDTYTASAYGTASFTPDASAEGYVAYDDLTEEAVLAWVHESVNKEETETSIQARLDDQKAPATLSGTPWAAE